MPRTCSSKLRYCFFAFTTIALTACNNEQNNPQHAMQSSAEVESVKMEYDFHLGPQQWAAAFSDYPDSRTNDFLLSASHQQLPTGFNGKGFMLSGHNLSSDLFMFVKRKVTGLTPLTRYKIMFKVSFLSNTPTGCAGTGGPSGESLFLHVGYGESEPKQAGYYLNLDKGNQSNSGSQSKVLGIMGIDSADCGSITYMKKTLESSAQTSLSAVTDSLGSIWVFVGSDSGFTGKTTIYYENISVEFIRTVN